ncbi:FliG C-terminal domain-containing protein [Salinispira pacifica]|uniref:Flagellar motor switch protein FliG n=1 Tax=Salinispira pacifica TaxID=1307761 RepID=V5WLY1_9SPIO|nr:FliG C-terminal domain-containing protein [Salinispira pacifica]AHC16096.1 Flagellar motor switch protein FliG [Salinispira pacifica]
MELVTALESSDPELADEIKRRMFVFEDLVMLDPGALGKLLSQADPGDLALAVKRLPEELAGHLRNVMGEAKYASLKERSDGLGPVRVQDVDGARMRIIQVLKELEEAGEVLVGRQGEMIE